MIFVDSGAFCAFSDRRDTCHAFRVKSALPIPGRVAA